MLEISLTVQGRAVEPARACRRVMNFGQNWRGRRVLEARYRLVFPAELLGQTVDAVRADFRADSERYPDDEGGLEQVWRGLAWAPGATAIRSPAFLHAFVDFWGPELLDRVLPSDAVDAVWHLNTVDSATLEGEVVVLTGIAGRSAGTDPHVSLAADQGTAGGGGEIPWTDVRVWNLLHDGWVTALDRVEDRVRVTVCCPYLRERIAAPGEAFVIELLDVAEVLWRPFRGPACTDLAEIARSEPDLIEATIDRDTLCIFGSEGELRLRFRALELGVDRGRPLPLAMLEACAREYWSAWKAASSAAAVEDDDGSR